MSGWTQVGAIARRSVIRTARQPASFIPPPTTSMVFGIDFSSRAPVESMMRGSSGKPGSRTGSDPAAITQVLNAITCFASPSVTSR